MRQDIVLVSNASMDLYPDNKLSDFRVRLPRPVLFDSSYRVAITRLSFTKSFFNYEFTRGERWMNVLLSESKNLYTPPEADLGKCRLRALPLPGYYTPESLINMLNLVIKDIKIEGTDKLKSWPKYNLKNGYLECEQGVMINSAGYEVRWEVKFDPETAKVLGIDTDPTKPVFVNQNWTDLFVFSDLVYPTIIGDSTKELMCILDGQTERAYGKHCTEVFDQPWYHPLAKNNFQDIHIYIKNHVGEAPNFRFGRVNLRLSFRTEDEL